MVEQGKTVETVKIEHLVLGTTEAEKFVDELEKLCRQFASVSEASQGDGFSFKFKVEG